jgi:hypothetical protein
MRAWRNCEPKKDAAQPESLSAEEETSEEVVTGDRAEPTQGDGGPLKKVGTITASDGEGTTFRERFKLGPLLYRQEGTPPEAVLEACGANYASTIGQTVFSRGVVTISYSEGSLTELVPIVPNETVSGEGYLGITAYKVEGIWQCQDTFSLSFEPEESKTFPIWVLSQVLSNAEPEVSEAALNSWRFTPLESTPYPLVSTSGPGAARCPSDTGEEDTLRLYARPPFKGKNQYGNPVICHQA